MLCGTEEHSMLVSMKTSFYSDSRLATLNQKGLSGADLNRVMIADGESINRCKILAYQTDWTRENLSMHTSL